MKRALFLLTLAAGMAQAQHGGHHGGHPGGGHGAQKHSQAASPYAGMQSREIKALSAEDTTRLMQGHGMSLALAAELNGYPGPSHVLELADPLQLSAGQRTQTQALMDGHKAEARELGRQIVEAERQLDAAFKGGQATPDEVTRHTRRIGELQGQLRDAHLQTHLKQNALLTPEQVAQYNQLRGYTTAAAGAGPASHSHGASAAANQEQKPWGTAGQAKNVTRTIEIRMTDTMRFAPARIEVTEGETVRLVARNAGKVLHEIVLGTPEELKKHAELMRKHPGMEHDEPDMVHVRPGRRGEIVWNFNRPGTFQFACLIPGHFEAGMVGTLVVQPKGKQP